MMCAYRTLQLTSGPGAAIKTSERARRRATSQQCPGVSPGRRLERMTSPRFPADTRGGHESKASQVVAWRALSPMLSMACGSEQPWD